MYLFMHKTHSHFGSKGLKDKGPEMTPTRSDKLHSSVAGGRQGVQHPGRRGSGVNNRQWRRGARGLSLAEYAL